MAPLKGGSAYYTCALKSMSVFLVVKVDLQHTLNIVHKWHALRLEIKPTGTVVCDRDGGYSQRV